VTESGATANGHFRLFAAGTPLPATSTINYRAGQTIANNGIVAVGAGAGLTVYSGQASGTAHVIVDVSGYYQ